MKSDKSEHLEILTCSARDYVESASASSHNLIDYRTLGVVAHDHNYDMCENLLKEAAVELGAEVVVDTKDANTIKPDEDIQGHFEMLILMRGTALVPNNPDSSAEPKIN